METRKSGCAPLSRPATVTALFLRFLLVILCPAMLVGCGAPGQPRPPHPSVPQAIGDLTAQQVGDGVTLTFTLPQETIEREALETAPEVAIYREFVPASAASTPNPAPKGLVYTIPGALVDTYQNEGRVRFVDPLKPEELASHAGEQVVYVVRTSVSKRHASTDSNVATTRIYPVPEPIRSTQVTVTEDAIELRWQAPEQTATGRPVSAVVDYRVYRAEIAPSNEAEAAENPAAAKRKGAPALVGVTPSPSYRDAQFQFGHTYLYTVRSVVQYDANSVESADSAPVVVTPRDIFPPAPPKNLVVVFVPGTAGAPPHLDLSWAISPEPDLAGYRVYRSEQEGVQGQCPNGQLLLTPTFSDISVVASRRYFYTVTAVDRAGNESLPSAPVSAIVPKESEGVKP